MTSLAGAHQTGKSQTRSTRSNPGSLPLVQRKCDCGNSPGLTGQCEDCEKEKLVQRSAVSETAQPSTAPEVFAQMQSMRNSGEPLNAELRDFFEPRFGHDFSRVRIHTDARAADTSKALNARAYTVGSDVAFASGEYKPETSDGRRLLAHELTHVVQQENSNANAHVATSTFNVAPADDPSELEADQVARDVCSGSAVSGTAPHHLISSAHTVHRQPAAAPPAPPQVEGPCSSDFDETVLKPVRTAAEDMIQKARDTLATLKNADLKKPNEDQQNALTALSRNFAVKPADVEKHLDTIRDRLRDMQSHSSNSGRSSFVCSSSGTSGPCGSKADAYTRHNDGQAVIGFCPTFMTLSAPLQRDTYVHELAHATDPIVKDWAYTTQRAYGMLTTDVALLNADSYAQLATDLREITTPGEKRFDTLGYTARKDSLKACGPLTETLTKAMAEAELANFAALRSLNEEELWKARGQILSWFNLVVRSPSGDCKKNEALAKKYSEVFTKADDLFTGGGLVLECDATEGCKTGPAHYDGKVMRICLSWDRAVSRFGYFGWPNAILQAIYAHIDGVAIGPVAGAPKEYRGANAAAIASHMIASQRYEGSKDSEPSRFCQSIAPLRPDEKATTVSAAATRTRPSITTGAEGWPVSELQEKLQVLAAPDLVVNGVFDDATHKALIKFQESANLVTPETGEQKTAGPSIAQRGVADAPTWTALFTRLPGFHGLPHGETFEIVGFRKDNEITMLDFNQKLLPTSINFKGLKVIELDPGGGVNTCCAYSPSVCRRRITGGFWFVRNDNIYGEDTVGFTLPQVESYQRGLRMANAEACAYAIPQVMVAELPEGQYEFARAVQFYFINKNSVACSKLNKDDKKGASMTIPRKES